MRIVNVTAFRRTFSYATQTPGGVELDPGKESADIPVSRLLTQPLIFADIEAKVCAVRLSAEDESLLKRIVEVSKMEIVVAKPPPKPKRPPKKKAKAAAEQAAQQPKKPSKPAVPVTKEAVAGGQVSLADLQLGNSASGKGATAAERKRKIAEVQAHMGGPMGSVLETGVPK
jgi:hypothetical protein